ncbi:unnamed protein product [Caenorhabditis nigoni]
MHTYHIKVINSSARRIGYGIKTTNMKRLGVEPPSRPKGGCSLSCDVFAFGQEDTNNDVSPLNGPTPQTVPPSNSVGSGSKETE